MLFWLSKDDKELLFRSYSVLKGEGKKILNKQMWQVTVKATEDEVAINGDMFPKNRKEIPMKNGNVMLKFSLDEVNCD